MKTIKHYIAAAACFALLQPAVAQKQTPPAGGTAKDFKLSAKNLQSHANGLKTTTVHYGELPKATISLIIKTGNVHEGTDKVWLADLTGRMLREGTSALNFAALSKKSRHDGRQPQCERGPGPNHDFRISIVRICRRFYQTAGRRGDEPGFPRL